MDICTCNEMLGMQRMEGSAGILSGFATKFGGALGAYLTGALLAAGGYVSSASATAQPASAVLMIRIVYALVPCFLVAVIGICCLAFSGLEKKIAVYEARQKEEKEEKEAAKAE